MAKTNVTKANKTAGQAAAQTEQQLAEKAAALKEARAKKCADEINAVLKKHNCSLQTDLPLSFQGQPLKVSVLPL
jgi:hypothetical protein